MKDSKVKLYTGKPVLNKSGNIHHREEKIETCFRPVVIKTKKETKNFGLWPMNLNFSAKEIANDLEYKTAKKRIEMQIRDMITPILTIFAGGNPDKVFKT